MKLILNTDGLVEYYADFFKPDEAEYFFNALRNEIDWQADQLIMYGKQIITKRKVAWYGDQEFDYRYSNTTKTALPWTPALSTIKEKLQSLTGIRYNSCLLNLYHDGNEGMGWHNDNEVMMKKHAPIASISLGAVRPFMFRHIKSKEQHSLELENGSLLLMKAETQDYWKHQLPIRKGIKSPRINLTFREFDTHFQPNNLL